jgi:hypothetical protein
MGSRLALLMPLFALLAMGGCGATSESSSERLDQKVSGQRTQAGNDSEIAASSGDVAVCAHESGLAARAARLEETADFEEMKSISLPYLVEEVALRGAIEPPDEIGRDYDTVTKTLDTTRFAFGSSADWSEYLETLKSEAISAFGSEAAVDAATRRYRRWVNSHCDNVRLRPDDYEFGFEP